MAGMTLSFRLLINYSWILDKELWKENVSD